MPWRRLLGYVRPHLRAFAVAVAALLVGLAVGLLMPLAIGEVVSRVLAGDAAGMTEVLLLLAGLALLLALASLVQTRTLGVIGERIVAQLRTELFGQLVTLELDFFGRRRVGELISRLSSDVTQVRTLLDEHGDRDPLVAAQPHRVGRDPARAEPDPARSSCWSWHRRCSSSRRWRRGRSAS